MERRCHEAYNLIISIDLRFDIPSARNSPCLIAGGGVLKTRLIPTSTAQPQTEPNGV
jgi:hypothetical protein